ncbi:hypothetical protein RHO14_02090 [Orbus wheelerorum]|uniref:hypothetical protein n=1 Tax=Orbus wheelerorum TaxID=3074111 RepID=UPI00370DC99E
MLGNLLSKILPKKKEPIALTGRELYGRNNVGYPTMQISAEIDNLVSKYYRDITPLIKFYKETFLFKWGPAIINNSLDDEQLKNLSGRNVQMVYLLLFRDMLRHISTNVIPKNASSDWPNLLAQNLLDNCEILNDSDDKDSDVKLQLFAQIEQYDIESEGSQLWVEPIAKLIFVPAKDLYYWHRTLTNAIMKKVSKKKL